MPEITEPKKLEREILQALGWRLHVEQFQYMNQLWHAPQCGPDCDERHYDMQRPNLSDPSTFWPMFEAWFKSVKSDGDGFTGGDNYSSGFGTCHWFDIYMRGKRHSSYGDASATQTDAGIRCWHKVLSTLGKIKAG